MITRYAITHISAATGLRRLTFSQCSRDTYATETEALDALGKFKLGGLSDVLFSDELRTLRVDAVQCYDHGDPVRYYIEDEGAGDLDVG